MKTLWELPTEDGKTIYGLLDTANDQKNDKAILVVHGLTGHPGEVLHKAAARHFPPLGYDVLRVYLYCDKKNARRLKDCTLAIHGRDVDTVAQHFSQSYKTLYAAGHSYGGPSVLLSDTSRFRAVCLWDPSFKQKYGLSGSFMPKDDHHVIAWDQTIKVGHAMTEENIGLDRAFGVTLAKNCKAPVRVVLAGDGDYVRQGTSYHDFTKTQSDMKIVPGTSHCFDEPGTTEPLMHHTQEWFDKFQPV